AEQRGLAAAGRADEGGNAVRAEREIDVLQRVMLAIVKIEVARGDLRRHLGARCLGGSTGTTQGYRQVVHFALLSAPRMRAPMFRASTARVISSAPLQASCFQ